MNVRVWKREGMTLVELLIVIGCVAILALLLFPVFSTIRQKANQSRCLNTLHTLWQANQSIATDDGKFVDDVEPWTGGIPSGVWWWGGPTDNTKLGRVLKVQGLGGMLVCPAARNEVMPMGWMTNVLSYCYNAHLSGVVPARISRPADKVMFMDSKMYLMDQYMTFDLYGDFRHQGKADIVFVDGHCESRAVAELSVSVNLGTYAEP